MAVSVVLADFERGFDWVCSSPGLPWAAPDVFELNFICETFSEFVIGMMLKTLLLRCKIFRCVDAIA